MALFMLKRNSPEFFGGRNMVYESRSITRVKRAKELRAVLAMWINDQEGVDKHVKVRHVQLDYCKYAKRVSQKQY